MRPRCWRTATTGEIAALAGAADDPRYFQVLADGHQVNFAGRVVGRSLLRRPNLGLRSTAALPFLELVPDVAAKLKEPLTAERQFEDVVKSAQEAAVLVLVY